MKKLFILGISFFAVTLFLFHSQIASAVKRKIIRKTTATTSGSTISSGRMIIKPKFRIDRNALIVIFSNLNVVSSFTYELTYTGDGLPQGASGTVTPEGDSTQRELLFGTCSKNVCRYHTGKKDMKFIVTYTLKTGEKYRKSFAIRP